jgi:cytochrome d ubiquinol oxidase subunit II
VLVAFSHGYILARVAVAYQPGGGNTGFAVLMGGCAVAVYSLLGASWLMMREAGELRVRAVGWARRTLRWGAVGAVGVSVVLDFSNAGVFRNGATVRTGWRSVWSGARCWRVSS